MTFIAPRGTRDILPDETFLWQKIEKTFFDVCHKYGYGEIRIPTFEHTEIYQRGVGDTTDIVQKEMYTFLDKSERSLTLRPEGTAGVVRSFIENGMGSLPYPVKLFYNLTLFRYERVAKGRYREFHQLGVEVFGSTSPYMEVEVIALLYDFFQALGLKQMKLRLNSIGNLEDRAVYNEKFKEHLFPNLSHFCSDCQNRFHKNPLRMLDCKVEKCQNILVDAPQLFDFLGETSRKHHDLVCQGLNDLGIPYEIDKNIVRGLDYYTQTVFEFVSENVGTQGTICGGGRYDNLVSDLGGKPTPACGFAIGTERLIMELKAQAIAEFDTLNPDIFVASIGEDALRQANLIAEMGRRKNLCIHADICGRGLKAQLKYADKKGYRYVAVIGEDELSNGRVKLKPLLSKEDKLTEDFYISWQDNQIIFPF